MLLIHPLIQAMAITGGLTALFLGIQRFRSRHMGHSVTFSWKKHVKTGAASLVVMLTGIFGGFMVTCLSWNRILITGIHAYGALIIIPLIFTSITTGAYMNKKKQNRASLTLFHAIVNTVLMICAIFQIYSGIMAYSVVVSGY